MADGLVGQVINGKYRVVGVLGEGGMGVVYKAEQLVEARVLREVGLKMIRPDLDLDPYRAAKASRDFLDEMYIAAQLSGPHVVTVYDFGQTERRQLYFSMEFVRGPTLKEVLQQQQGVLPVQRVVTIVQQICDALAEAHGAVPDPIVHCDLKPANIFLINRQEQDWVKIGDFGIAKLLRSLSEVTTRIEGRPSPGTPRYMAPEQWRGEDVDGRTDLYALGVMMYEMLTGKPPFSGTTELLRYQHLNKAPPPLPLSVPPALDRLVTQMLAKELQARPTDVVQVRHALERESQWDEALAKVAAPNGERTTLRPTAKHWDVREKTAPQGGSHSKQDIPVTYRKTARRRPVYAILLIGVLVGIGAATYTWPPGFLQPLFVLTANLLKSGWLQGGQNGVGIIPKNQEEQLPQAGRKGGEDPGEVTAGTKTGEGNKSQQGKDQPTDKGPPLTMPPPTPLPLLGHLQVNVNVPTASVKVDGVDRGVAHQNEPLSLSNLAAGTIRVRVEAKGHELVERLIAIEPNKWTQEGFVLKPLPPPSSPPADDPSSSVTYWELDESGNLVSRTQPNPQRPSRLQRKSH